jgi:hypothetical protein
MESFATWQIRSDMNRYEQPPCVADFKISAICGDEICAGPSVAHCRHTGQSLNAGTLFAEQGQPFNFSDDSENVILPETRSRPACGTAI